MIIKLIPLSSHKRAISPLFLTLYNYYVLMIKTKPQNRGLSISFFYVKI